MLVRVAPSSNRCARSGSSRDRSKPRPAAAVSAAASAASLDRRQPPARSRAAAAAQGSACRGTPSRVREHRAQALVPLHQIAQRPSSAARSSAPAQPHRQRDHIVPPAVRRLPPPPALQPVQEPQPALRIRQRDLRRPRPRAASGARGRLPPPSDSRSASAATLGASNRLRIATSTSSARADPADQPRRQQRVPAELEEVVVDADPLDPQHLGKQRAQDRLLRRRAAHAAAPPATNLRRRQRTPVELAVRRQRQPLQHHDRRRHHVVRQAAADSAARSPAASSAAPAGRHHIAHQPLAAPRRRPRATTAACDTPACRSSTASISPGSIRNPRSFTCASARPRNSSTPSARHRARSPVRYIRLARHAPCGSATNRSAVRPARFR